MTITVFSDHFSTTGIATSLTDVTGLAYDRNKRLIAGLSHGRVRYKRASIVAGTGTGIGDMFRMCQFKSGDRLHSVMLSTSGGSAGATDIGLYKSGFAHDGAVIDADLIGSAVTTSGTVARVDQFKESTTLKDIDRGKTLWELVTIGAAATYTSDPFEDWDLVLTFTTAITVSLQTIVTECFYTSGD